MNAFLVKIIACHTLAVGQQAVRNTRSAKRANLVQLHVRPAKPATFVTQVEDIAYLLSCAWGWLGELMKSYASLSQSASLVRTRRIGAPTPRSYATAIGKTP